MPLPDLADVIRYLLAYDESYQLDAAGRTAQYEREGKTLITHNQVHLPGDDEWASGVEIINAVTREVLWTGPADDWPDDDTWVHEDHIHEATHGASPERRYAGLPHSLLDALDEWVSSNSDEAKQMVSEA